jgi:2-succinyl-5-enolpyruvyl-6-hydroxy-3-cyclohexene-1-carboxylate synthase
VWSFEAELAGATLPWVRSLACRAWAAMLDGRRPGVVHLNVPLRDPLVPPAALPPDASGRPDGRPWVRRVPVPRHRRARPVLAVPAADGRRRGHRRAGRAARRACPSSPTPLSAHRAGPAAIAHYDALLRDEASRGATAPSSSCGRRRHRADPQDELGRCAAVKASSRSSAS